MGRRYSLARSRRVAVSTYLEVFILIGVALGGSAIVADAAWTYSGSAQGPSLQVSGAAISQGTGAAVEKLTLYDSGNSQISGIALSTTGVSSSAQFCYSVLDPVKQSVLASTCPTLSSNPTSVSLQITIQPGGSAVIELLVTGTPFTIGSSYTVTVSTSQGLVQTMGVKALPA